MTVPVTAILVTYNSAHCVGPCLQSLQELVDPAEIVVVDNASSDDSVAAVHSAAPRAAILEPGTNLGFGRACNLAVERATSPNVMLVNPDVVFTHADTEALAEALAPEPLGLLVPLVAGRHQLYPYPSWRSYVARQAWAHARPRELGSRAPRADPDHSWPAATVLLARRDEYQTVGGFDARYFLYAEDVDLARRYRAHDFPVRLTDALAAEHVGAASSASDDSARPVAHTWSILGTIEYVSIWDGDRAAARAASFVLGSLRAQRLALRALPGARMARKRKQVEDMTDFLVAHARSEPSEGAYCPGARRALLSSLG